MHLGKTASSFPAQRKKYPLFESACRTICRFAGNPFVWSPRSAPHLPAQISPAYRYLILKLEILRKTFWTYQIPQHSQFSNSSCSVSNNLSSGTFLTISPCLISKPSPSPPAIPISASFASPGPLTAQPMTATLISSGNSAAIVST